MLFFSLSSAVWAQGESSGSQNAMLKEINKALAEQNQALAEQNQALAEQVDAYDKRVSVLEANAATLQKHVENSASIHRALPRWLIILFVFTVIFVLVDIIYSRRLAIRLRKQVDEYEDVFRIFRNDKQRIERVREELERTISAKESDLRSEISAMSIALTSVHKMNEEKLRLLSEGDASEQEVDPTSGEGYVAPLEDTTDGKPDETVAVEEEKTKISSDQCFAAMSTIFIRNEQRVVAVEGGVSITTANKWLDAWERNGWIEKVARGKYMKTSKGKKVSKQI